MNLTDIQLINFRSHSEFSASFSEKIVCISGNNGSGKTNILDAIYYLAFCKSYFTSIDQIVIKQGQDDMLVKGNFIENNDEIEVSCGYRKAIRKSFKLNNREYEKLSDHIGKVLCVMISPTDIELVYGGSEERRKFMDFIIAQFDRPFLHHLMLYNKLLSQRNALLKQLAERNSNDYSLLDVIDQQIEVPGNEVFETRKNFLAEFSSIINEVYHQLSGGKELIEIYYDSKLKEGLMLSIFANSREKDLQAHTTTQGIHKDDLRFELNGMEVRKFASQGQQKTFLLSLKLAQYYWLSRKTGRKPILLLDDIFEKLDSLRIKSLFKEIINPIFGQVFITDTNVERMMMTLNELKIQAQYLEI